MKMLLNKQSNTRWFWTLIWCQYYVLQVTNSQDPEQTPSYPWILAEKDGTILSTNCTCKAGLAATCVHAAAMMFYVESAVRLGDENTMKWDPDDPIWLLPEEEREEAAKACVRICDMDFSTEFKIRREQREDGFESDEEWWIWATSTRNSDSVLLPTQQNVAQRINDGNLDLNHKKTVSQTDNEQGVVIWECLPETYRVIAGFGSESRWTETFMAYWISGRTLMDSLERHFCLLYLKWQTH